MVSSALLVLVEISFAYPKLYIFIVLACWKKLCRSGWESRV